MTDAGFCSSWSSRAYNNKFSSVLLLLDILANGAFGNVACRFAVVRSRPKRWQAAFYVREFCSDHTRRVAFKLLDDMVRTVYGSCFDKQVYMIRHNF